MAKPHARPFSHTGKSGTNRSPVEVVAIPKMFLDSSGPFSVSRNRKAGGAAALGDDIKQTLSAEAIHDAARGAMHHHHHHHHHHPAAASAAVTVEVPEVNIRHPPVAMRWSARAIPFTATEGLQQLAIEETAARDAKARRSAAGTNSPLPGSQTTTGGSGAAGKAAALLMMNQLNRVYHFQDQSHVAPVREADARAASPGLVEWSRRTKDPSSSSSDREGLAVPQIVQQKFFRKAEKRKALQGEHLSRFLGNAMHLSEKHFFEAINVVPMMTKEEHFRQTLTDAANKIRMAIAQAYVTSSSSDESASDDWKAPQLSPQVDHLNDANGPRNQHLLDESMLDFAALSMMGDGFAMSALLPSTALPDKQHSAKAKKKTKRLSDVAESADRLMPDVQLPSSLRNSNLQEILDLVEAANREHALNAEDEFAYKSSAEDDARAAAAAAELERKAAEAELARQEKPFDGHRGSLGPRRRGQSLVRDSSNASGLHRPVNRVTSPVSLLADDDKDRATAEQRMKEIEVSSLQRMKDVYNAMAIAKKNNSKYQSRIKAAMKSAGGSSPGSPDSGADVVSPSQLEQYASHDEKSYGSAGSAAGATKEKKKLNFGKVSGEGEKVEKAASGIPGTLLETITLDDGLSVAIHGFKRAAAAPIAASSDDGSVTSSQVLHPGSFDQSETPMLLSPGSYDYLYLTLWLINTTEHDAFTVHALNDDQLGFDLLPFKAGKHEHGGVLAVVIPGAKLEAGRLMPTTTKCQSPTYAMRYTVLRRGAYTPPTPPPPVAVVPPPAEKPVRVPRKLPMPGSLAPSLPPASKFLDGKDNVARQEELSKAMQLYKDLQILQVNTSAEGEPQRDVSMLRRPTALSASTAQYRPPLSPLPASARRNTDGGGNGQASPLPGEMVSNTEGGQTQPPSDAKKKAAAKRRSRSGSTKLKHAGDPSSQPEDGTPPPTGTDGSDVPVEGGGGDGDASLHGCREAVPDGTGDPTSALEGMADGDPSVPFTPTGGGPVNLGGSVAFLPPLGGGKRRNTTTAGKAPSRGRTNTVSSPRDTRGGGKRGGRRESVARMEKRNSEISRENKLYDDMYLREDQSGKKEPRSRFVRPKSSSVFEVSTLVKSRTAARTTGGDGVTGDDDVAKIIRSLRNRPLAPTSANRGIVFATPLGAETSLAADKDAAPTKSNAKPVTADVLLEKLAAISMNSSLGGSTDANARNSRGSVGFEDDTTTHTDTDGSVDGRSRHLRKSLHSPLTPGGGGRKTLSAGSSASDGGGSAGSSNSARRQSTAQPGQLSAGAGGAGNRPAARGGLRREARPNQIRTLGGGVGSPASGAPGGSRTGPGGRTRGVSFVEADENNAVLDAVLAPMGRSLFDNEAGGGDDDDDDYRFQQEQPTDGGSGGGSGGGGGGRKKDFVDRMLDEAAAKGSPLAGSSLLMGRIKASSSGTFLAPGGGRQRAHTISGTLSTPKPAPPAPADGRRFTTIRAAVERKVYHPIEPMGAKVDDSYRASCRTSVTSIGPEPDESAPSLQVPGEDDGTAKDDETNFPISASVAALLEDGDDDADDAKRLFLHNPERFAAVTDDLVNSVAEKLAGQRRPPVVVVDEWNDGLEHPSHDIQTYSVPRHRRAMPVAGDVHGAADRANAALLAQLAASDAEAARLYDEQQRLSRILSDLVGQVKDIWTVEKTESAEARSSKSFFQLSMDVAWRLQQRRSINLGKLLNLLERKCGERSNTGKVRNAMHWMPYYRDDNVLVVHDAEDAVDDDPEGSGNAMMGHPTHGLLPRRLVTHGFHPPPPGMPGAGGGVFGRDDEAVSRVNRVDCGQEMELHVQRLVPPGKLEELVPTYAPQGTAGLCFLPSRPPVPQSAASRPCTRVTLMQFVGAADFNFDPTRLQGDDAHYGRPRPSGRQIARERLRALRRQRMKLRQRFVLMDGTEIEMCSRYPSWQTRYS